MKFSIASSIAALLQIALIGALEQKPIRRVGIIGSGVAGLTLAHALQELDQVEIFDARSELNRKEGAGFQLNGGLASFEADLQRAVAEAGMPLEGIQSRSKAWFGKTENQDYSTLLQLNINELIRQASEEVSDELLDDDGNAKWTAITRGALQEVLRNNLPSSVPIRFNKKLTSINEHESGGVLCGFDDGSCSGPFDMVVGCDGIRSATKEFVNTAKIEEKKTSLAPSNAIYSGIRIRFAVVDETVEEKQTSGTKLTQYFGDGGYALHGKFGAGKGRPLTSMAVFVYLDENYIGPFQVAKERKDRVTVGENADWTQTVEQQLESSRSNMLSQLTAFNIPDKDKALESVIRNADRIYELGSYFHNPFTRWSRILKNGSCVVLCGDAAHAMPPFLGQGSNQAIQSAYCLGNKILEYNQQLEDENGDLTLEKTLATYREVRWKPTFNILWKALFLGYLETGGGNGIYSKPRDSFFQLMGAVGVAKGVLLGAAVPKIR
jgi:2-polyprenyl-6-methoxyphenol hydroxylase-like FAD-dependent oxidoreductase